MPHVPCMSPLQASFVKYRYPDDNGSLPSLISKADVVVSLLPATMHVPIAKVRPYVLHCDVYGQPSPPLHGLSFYTVVVCCAVKLWACFIKPAVCPEPCYESY
jgi:hypothetical protein